MGYVVGQMGRPSLRRDLVSKTHARHRPGISSSPPQLLEIERLPAPAKGPAVFFRDFFNRDDSPDINSAVTWADQWVKVRLHPAMPERIGSELYKTSLKLIGSKSGKGLLGMMQKKPSPEKGIIRYATRVSLFTGEGSKIHSGFQEAGLLILGDTTGTIDFNSTFIGIAFDRSRSETRGVGEISRRQRRKWIPHQSGNPGYPPALPCDRGRT